MSKLSYSENFMELVQKYKNTEIEVPDFKAVTVAIWILESGRGEKSDLAKDHRNYAGMKYHSSIKDICKRVNYKKKGYYCEFENLDDFIKGFWMFLEQDTFKGWKDKKTALKFLSHIAPFWSKNKKYESDVIRLLDEATKLLADAKIVKKKKDKAAILPVPPKKGKWKKIAIIIGHNKKGQGAKAIDPIGRTEFDFNSELAKLMEKRSKQYNVITKSFFREQDNSDDKRKRYGKEIRKAYKKVNEWNPDYSIELHFNAAGKAITGTEVLTSGTKESIKYANLTQKEMVKLFKRKGNSRGVKTLKIGDRGYYSLFKGNAPAIIVEPFFGSSKSDCELMKKLGLKKLADAYLSAMSKL
ncbi:MAG: N-acetylmuramoyl-L-alanine amidase [Maribacter sp.]|jgi:N-acetylmuramoyl-L-alanine amidase